MSATMNFGEKMEAYRRSIDTSLQEYSNDLLRDTKNVYGEQAAVAVEAYCSLLARGGKRIRGSLVLNGYQMCGGQNEGMALEAACAVEMMHAYILAIDDIQDRSELRRGGPTAHSLLQQESVKAKWRGDHAHTGISLALNGALIGAHYAQNVLADLKVSEPIRLRVLKLMNSTMIITAHGQTGDIINEVNGAVTKDDIDAVVLRKTAHYTILNPLQIGMCLAGADENDLQIVSGYALEVGRAFQITDDALMYTASHHDKDPSIDIKDGKMTLIMDYALRHAKPVDEEFIRSCLGNQDLTQHDFERCVLIVEETGAVIEGLKEAKESATKALAQLNSFPKSWNHQSVSFLGDLAQFIVKRNI